MFRQKYAYVALFVVTSVKCIENVTETSSSNKSSVTVVPENQFDSTLKLYNTEEPLSSLHDSDNKNDIQASDQNIKRNLGVGRRELIIYQYDDLEPRRNWHVPRKPILRSRLRVTPRGRSRGRVRPIGRNGVNVTRSRKRRTKEKVINKTAKVLLYKEYDDNGHLINNVTMRDLDDVAKFFYVYLDVLLCYDECQGVIFPTNSTSVAPTQSGVAINGYYEVKEYYQNGSYSVVESSTKWL